MTGGLVLLKLLASLAGVVGLIFVLQRVARRYGGALGSAPGPERIRLVSQRALAPRQSVALVQVMGRYFLVGVSPQGIRPVADLGPAPAAGAEAGFAAVEERAPALESAPVRFLARGLWRPLLRWGAPAPSARGEAPARPARSEAPAPPQRWEAPALSARPEAPVPSAGSEAAPGADARPAASFADKVRGTGVRRSAGACPPVAPKARFPRPSGFEEELERRLSALRARYPSVDEVVAKGEPL
jgi:flagellar biosynthetic protein FliO